MAFSGPRGAAAHEHVVRTPNHDQYIANGQNHAPFKDGVSCESTEGDPRGLADPAGYGLETAHHGPDAGTPGKGDGCYETTDKMANPKITNLPPTQ